MATIVFKIWWTMGSRRNVHDLLRATSTQYTTGATLQNGEAVSYRELLQRQSRETVTANFWSHYRLHRAGRILEWDMVVPIANDSIDLVARIGHWSSQSMDMNPLVAFGDRVWVEKK